MEEAKAKILTLLDPYFETLPIVNLRLLNFRISVNGEVNGPGTFTIPNERVTIIEAVTMAGDFTSYSRRDSVLIVREADGVRTFGYVDFNSADVFTSPYFYLHQNDVIYIRPEKTKIGTVRDPATRVLPWVTTVVSVTAFIISILRR
jgi:polysaccharide export outer membrane protein